MQRALIQYRNPKNYYLVREALEKAGRQDLIGYSRECLIRPFPGQPPHSGQRAGQGKSTGKDTQKDSTARKKSGKRPAGWAKPKTAKTGKPNSRRKKGPQ